MHNPLLPGSTLGILGGGQLGRMVALEARRLGYKTITLDPTENSPCGQVADRQITAAFTDVEAALQLAKLSDVVIYEFEDVDDAVVRAIEDSTDVPQGSRLLAVTRHRLREKSALGDAGIPVARHLPVNSLTDLSDAKQTLGCPFIVKTTTGGYDGKGQWRVQDGQPLEELFAVMEAVLPASRPSGATDAKNTLEAAFVAEVEVPFIAELSVVVARGRDGNSRPFPVAENIHREHILQFSICPARIPAQVAARAEKLAAQAADALGVVGLLGVEMFLLADGELLVNEVAPRPHNSGHFTQDACVTSQFEQALRCATGLPLGSPDLLSPVVMTNILGEHLDGVFRTLADWPDTFKLHLYGKAEARPKRKMGHVNVLAKSTDAAIMKINEVGIWGNHL